MVDEDDNGGEVEIGGKSVRYCVECALQKGYAHYREIKGEKTLTFLRDSDEFASGVSADIA
jgi:hypothetical protein